MALVLKDRVKQTAAAPGTGTITLSGSVTGFQSFSVIGNGNTTYFAIYDPLSGAWEVNYGTYTSSGTTLTRNATPLSSSNSGSLVNFTGVVDVFVTYPSENAVWRDTSGVVVQQSFGDITATSAALTTGTITTAPANATDIVNKEYADSISSGLNYHQPANYASTTTLPTYIYNNGASGVGATITAVANGALSLGGGSPTATQRVLVKDEVAGNAPYNGIYVVTQAGSSILPFILTRATDYDTSGAGTNEIDQGDYVLVISGTLASTAWVQQTPLPITVGTTGLVFLQFNAPITYYAGTGLTLSPATTFNIATTGVSAATYGSASSVPVITVNSQGQATVITNTAIAINGSAVSGNIAGQAGSVANALTLGTYLTGTSYNGSAAVTAAVDATSANTASKVVARDSSGNFSAGTITATLSGAATSATTATNIAGGAANQIPYQTGAATTSFVAAPTVAGTYLNWTGSAFAYSAISLPNNATFNNGGAGDASGTTFNGSAARTISYNTVGASPLAGSSSLTTTGTVTSGTWSASFGAVSGANLTSLTAGNLSGTIPSAVLGNSTAYVGTTAVALNRASANQALTGISSVTLPGATSGSAQITPNAVAGTGTVLTLPATTGTLALTSDLPTVNNATLTMNTSGTGLSGSQTFTANQATGATFTVASNATNANTASTIVARDASGNFSAGTITATLSGAATSATTAGTITSQANSATITATSANTASQIVLRDASGNFSAGTITATLSGNATSATTATTATTATSSPKVSTPDLRSTALTPSYFGQGLNTAFMANSTDGLSDGGAYHGIIQFQQWSDASGGGSAEIAITDNNNVWHRGSSGGLSSWASWYKFIDSGNYNSYVPTLTGTGASGTWGISISGNAATATTAANYLPLSGGTLTGDLTIAESGALPIISLQSTGVSGGINWRIRSGIEAIANGGFSIRDTTAGANRFYIDSAGSVTATVDYRAPIFYDSNDTSYYVDPNSVSVLNNLIVNVGAVSNNNAGLRNVMPTGGSYVTSSSSVAGAIVITLPVTVYPMIKFRVSVYTYDGLSFDIYCGGHNSSGYWYNTFAYMGTQNRSPLNVRFTYGSGLMYVYIGEIGQSWSYPQVFVTDVQVGYTNYEYTNWDNGWTISFNSSTYNNVSSTHVVNPPPQSGNNSSAVYAPVFYDYSNTAYYADPNSTSNFVGLTVANTISGSISGNAATATNVAGMVQNSYTTYTNNAITTAKNSYYGIVFGTSSSYSQVMFDGSGNGGFYREASGWGIYWTPGTSSLGIMSSTTSSSYALYVTGSIYATANVTAYSDRRAKKNIETIDNALGKTNQLRGVYYEAIEEQVHDTAHHGKRLMGVIAQEVLEVVPEVVTYDKENDKYGVSYANMVGLLIEAVKELSDKVTEQDARIARLEALVNQLIGD